MSKTLFWYIFGNLLRVFFLTTGALAGMMSFAVLLRPLTENGLDFGQVNRLLIYSLPAVCAYSLPISALFATTVVYGRVSADNELVAMRAGGISYFSPRRFSVALPALVLGLFVAVISMLMLCFIVPIYSLKVEAVIYSNIARVIANKIERTHALGFQRSDGTNFNVYADAARLMPADPAYPTRQRVELIGPAWMQYTHSPTNAWVMIPREFWMARSAMVSIDQASPTKASMVTVELNDGVKFPRIFFGNVQAGVGSSGFGPFEIPSLINENVKFLDISRLAQLAHDPGQSRTVQSMVRALIRTQQQQAYLSLVSAGIDRHAADGTSSFLFANDEPDSDMFEIGARDVTGQLQGDELVFTSPLNGDTSSVWMTRTHGSQQTLLAHAQEMRIRVQPISSVPTDADAPADRMNVSIELFKVALRTQDGIDTPRLSYSQSFSVPMPNAIKAIDHKTLADFLSDPVSPGLGESDLHGPWRIPEYRAFLLKVEEVRANNAARSELHGRASFALSCLSLVMVGCALGVMFRSGNFLNAFAASFVPALLCITLVVSGQQMATHVSYAWNFTNLRNPLSVALLFIWSGNVIVVIAAIYLTVRLQRR